MNTLDILKQIIFSEWQLVTVVFTLVAFFAMVIGRYPFKTTMRASISAFIINFLFVSFFLYFDVTAEPHFQQIDEVNIDERLLEIFEENKERATNKELVALVQPIQKDGKAVTEVYVKNFHEEWDFHGKVRVATFDENDNVMKEQVFQVSLKPGEMKKIHSDFGDPIYSWFRYEFYPEGND